MSKLSDILKQVAPTIAGVLGTAAGGPFGGMAAKVLSEKLLGKPDASLKDIEAAVSGLPPDKLLELRAADNAFRLRMEELGYRGDELTAGDRDSARKMQAAALGSGNRHAQEFVYWYAWFWSVASVVYIGSVTFFAIPSANVRVVDTVLGFVLGTLVSTLIGYFYGTSFSERGARKREDREAAK